MRRNVAGGALSLAHEDDQPAQLLSRQPVILSAILSPLPSTLLSAILSAILSAGRSFDEIIVGGFGDVQLPLEGGDGARDVLQRDLAPVLRRPVLRRPVLRGTDAERFGEHLAVFRDRAQALDHLPRPPF